MAATLTAIAQVSAAAATPPWLAAVLSPLVTMLRGFGAALYQTYDVPGLPRTTNDQEPFHQQLKGHARRVTGRRRGDRGLLRQGRRTVYGVANRDRSERVLRRRLGRVAAADWQVERATLRTHQRRQAQRWRFRHDRTA